MFETIEKLLTIAIWSAAIILFVGGIISCITKIVSEGIGSKCLAIIAIILGIVAFCKMYDWTGHIAWCMLGSGIVICLFTGVLTNGEEDTTRHEPPDPGVIETFTTAYIDGWAKQKIIEEAVEKGIRKSRE